MPEAGSIENIATWMKLDVITPKDYVGNIMSLVQTGAAATSIPNF